MMLKRRLASMMLVVLLCFTIVPIKGEEVFGDIDNHAYQEDIMALYKAGIVRGMGDQRYAPDDRLTNAQALQVLVNMFDLNLEAIRFIKAPLATDYYVNAHDQAWYAEALIISAVFGIEADRLLMPGEAISRESFYHLLVTTMESRYNMPKVKLMPVTISDEKDIKADYQGSIQRGLAYGIMTLDMDGNLHPKNSLSRGEAARVVALALAYLKENNYVEIEDDALYPRLDTVVEEDGISFLFELVNPSDFDQTILYTSGQRFDMNVYNDLGDQVYNWSSNKSFIMMLEEIVIEKGSYQPYEISWDYKDLTGKKLPAGTYKVMVNSSFQQNGQKMNLQEEVTINIGE